MSHQPVIDGFEFASAGATQQGIIPVSEFYRLRDLLASDAGDIAYGIQGTRDERGRPALRVTARGALQLRCQRCLGAMRFEVRTDAMLVLAATQAEIDAEPADPSAPDRVLGSKEMALRELVEDELILELPYAPRHDDCAAGAAVAETEKAASPFAGLRGIMRGKH